MNVQGEKRGNYSQPTIVFCIVGLLIILSQKLLPALYQGITITAILLWIPALLILLRKSNSRESGIAGFSLTYTGYGIAFTIPFLVIYGVFLSWRGLLINSSLSYPDLSYGLPLIYSFFLETGAVSIPEEFFFRGYIQGAISDDDGTLKNDTSPWFSIAYSSALFAILHVVTTGNPTRLLVFFPGLLFGWLRMKTGNIAASVLSHSLCNMTHYLLTGQLQLH